MLNTTTIPTTEVSFPKQFNGYDKDEVDRYIKSLSEAYQTAYEEYSAVCTKYNTLVENCKTLDGELEQNKSNIAVIAKTLVDAESLAHKIITDAHKEADKVMVEAQAAAQAIKDNAYAENSTVRKQAQKIIDDANAEAAGAKEQALNLVNDSQIEAAQIEICAKKNLRQANEKMTRMINELQGMLASHTADVQAAPI